MHNEEKAALRMLMPTVERSVYIINGSFSRLGVIHEGAPSVNQIGFVSQK
jgi:hypothetical protein